MTEGISQEITQEGSPVAPSIISSGSAQEPVPSQNNRGQFLACKALPVTGPWSWLQYMYVSSLS